MRTKNIISNDGGEPFAVSQHLILRNMWEYYLEEADKEGFAYGLVMGTVNEWGYVSLDEIKPYVISKATGAELDEIMPPEGYHWEELQDAEASELQTSQKHTLLAANNLGADNSVTE